MLKRPWSIFKVHCRKDMASSVTTEVWVTYGSGSREAASLIVKRASGVPGPDVSCIRCDSFFIGQRATATKWHILHAMVCDNNEHGAHLPWRGAWARSRSRCRGTK